VDTHIKNLRQKLQKITGKKDIIQAVYGMGYTIE
jgi:DNA-binding response OmpR family regulator